MKVSYFATERRAEALLSNGATIHALNIQRQRSGELVALLQVVAPSGVLGGAYLPMGDSRRIYALAQSLAGANGLQPKEWQTELTAFYLGVEEALARVKAKLLPQDPGFVEIHGKEEPGAREFQVERIVPKGKVTSLYADGGVGKSYFSMVMAEAVAVGCSLLDELATVKGDVLFLDFEDDQEEFIRRAFEVARGLPLGEGKPPEGLYYRRVNQPLSEVFYDVLTFVTDMNMALVVVDSFGAACGGEAESSRDAIATMQLFQRLPCTVLLLDHEPKARDGRGATQFGSVYKRNLSRSQLRLEDRGWPEPGKHALLLRHTKLNYGPMRGGMPLYLRFDGDQVYVIKGNPDDPAFADDVGAEGQVLSVLEWLGQATARGIAGETGQKEGTVRNILTKLGRAKRVRITGKDGKAVIYAVAGAGAASEADRTAKCWRCDKALDSATDAQCEECGWLRCTCGACGCNYNPTERYIPR